ncbi:MAG: PEGA domain-containing protein [Candidatus Omnitrophica bacterium]|nr:PEGA domain-containing protein [Candidatus Omnitrophota bacterium]
MRKISLLLLICLSSVYLCGCATILNGTSQKIPVSSVPAGATVQVDAKDTYTTPVKLRLERRRDHILVFTKDGFDAQTINVMHVLSESVCGNTLLFGPLGWVFDIFAGTQYKLVPDKINVELKSVARGDHE